MPGPTVVDTHARSAGTFLGGRHNPDNQTFVASYFSPGRSRFDTHTRRAGYFLRDHTRHDTHTGCVPAFSPGHPDHDIHALIAGSFCEPIIRTLPSGPAVRLGGPPLTRHPKKIRPLLSTPARLSPTPIVDAPGTFLKALARSVTHSTCAFIFSASHSKIGTHRSDAGCWGEAVSSAVPTSQPPPSFLPGHRLNDTHG